jgi:hypothetical protein
MAASIFVGQQQELSRLCEAFDGAREGRGSLVMITGEPGHREDAPGARAGDVRPHARRAGARRPRPMRGEAMGVQLAVGPADALVDAPTTIEVTGLSPGEAIEIRSSMVAVDHRDVMDGHTCLHRRRTRLAHRGICSRGAMRRWRCVR